MLMQCQHTSQQSTRPLAI